MKLAYILSFLFHGWFWMGNWVFYYLTFGSYTTVAMLDSGALLAGLVYEIPTGAFADMLGKKKTLILAFLSLTVGNMLMGFASSLWMLSLGLWLFVCLAYALYSGTMEALVFDSLKSIGKEDLFDKKIGSLGALRLWAMALSAVVGGVAYTFNPGLPYLLSGLLSFVGLFVCFYLVEPLVDTEKFSWNSFFKQNTKGMKILFGSKKLKTVSYYLVISGGLLVFSYNLLDDLLAIEYGFNPTTISWLFAVACIVAGVAAHFIPRIKIIVSDNKLILTSVGVIAVCLVLSPVVGMWISALLLLVRVVGEAIYQNYSSVIVNKSVDSAYRATTLSSLSLLRNIPYSVLGTFVGFGVAFAGGAKNFALWFGLIVLTTVVFFWKKVEA